MGMWHGSFNFKCNKRITLLGLVPINKQSLEYSNFFFVSRSIGVTVHGATPSFILWF